MVDATNGRWQVSDAGKVCLAFIAALILAMAAMSWSWVPSMRGMLDDLGGPLPAMTKVVLSAWWLRAWIAVVLGGGASAFLVVTQGALGEALFAVALGIRLW